MFSFFKKKAPEKPENTESPLELEKVSKNDVEIKLDSQNIERHGEDHDKHDHFESAAEVEVPENIVSTTDTMEQPEPVASETSQPESAEQDSKSLFDRLKSGLSKTGEALTEGVGNLLLGKKELDDDVLEELETRLLMADAGVDATRKIIDGLTQSAGRDELKDMDSVTRAMYNQMVKILRPVGERFDMDTEHQPMVLLMVGINGAGKTTTIGKLARQLQDQGKSVMLAAGDTFRAAAVEQLQVWGERNNIPVVAQGTGADSASVIYDAIESARAKKIDILLADTAGRLHTQTNLMEELKKVKRVIQKLDATAPHEIMLIVDASIGQNALAQAREFNDALGLTGITVTKLDGTAKGGILFALAEQMGIPVRFIGVGEGINDLQEFDPYEFTGALLANVPQ